MEVVGDDVGVGGGEFECDVRRGVGGGTTVVDDLRVAREYGGVGVECGC